MAMTTYDRDKTDRRVVKTRKAIMRAFDTLISQGDITKITVSAIAREADIDRKTFYLHYRSVDELANYKAEECIERLLGALKEQGSDKSAEERVDIFLNELNSIFTENEVVYANIVSRVSTDQILEYFSNAAKPALSHVGLELDWEDEELRSRLLFYIAGIWALYSSWLRSDRDRPIEEVSSAVRRAISTSLLEDSLLS